MAFSAIFLYWKYVSSRASYVTTPPYAIKLDLKFGNISLTLLLALALSLALGSALLFLLFHY